MDDTPAAARLLVLTDSTQTPRPLLAQLSVLIDAGVRRIVLREKHSAPDGRQALAVAVSALLADAGGELIVADPSWPVAAAHLSAGHRLPRPRPRVVGRSWHEGESIDSSVDYVTYSPVFPSASKPGYGPPNGIAGLADACRRSPVPVFALGGADTPRRAADCRDAGAAGVAVMGAMMRQRRPRSLVGELLDALA